MSLRRIVLADDAVGSWVTTDEGRRPAEPGEAFDFPRLAEELRTHTPAEVMVTHRLPADDPDTALIVPAGMLRDLTDPPRALIAGASRTNMLDTLEQHKLAGAVEQGAWFNWKTGGRPAVLTGRRDVALAIGHPVTAEAPFASEHYGPISASHFPALLAAYLTAYFERSDA